MNLISTLRELRHQADKMTARHAGHAFSSDIRIAKTWSDTEASYPARPANVYGIIFLDANQNRTEHSTTVKQYAYHLANTNCYLPRGTTVAVVFINSQWWIVHCHRLKNEEPEFEALTNLPSIQTVFFYRDSTSTSYPDQWAFDDFNSFTFPSSPPYGTAAVGTWAGFGTGDTRFWLGARANANTAWTEFFQETTQAFLYFGRGYGVGKGDNPEPALTQNRAVICGIRKLGGDDPFHAFNPARPTQDRFDESHIIEQKTAAVTALEPGQEELLRWDVTSHVFYWRANPSVPKIWYLYPQPSWRTGPDNERIRSKGTEESRVLLDFPTVNQTPPLFVRYTTDPVP